MKKNKQKRSSVQKQVLSRRTMLRGTLGAAFGASVGLPLLDIMLNGNGNALADGTALPRRFGTFYWGGGVQHPSWVPTATGKNWALPYSLTPFEPVKNYVSMITGTNHANSSPGHIPSRGIALSGSHDMDTSVSGVGTFRAHRHPEPSVDALVAEHWVGQAPYDLLAVGISRSGPYKSNSSWKRGGSAYNRHEPSPQALFDRIFGNLTPAPGGNTPLLEATNALERSMLDAVIKDAQDLQSKLGASDRMRLEQHLEGIRELERRIQGVAMGTVCDAQGRPLQSNFSDGTANEQKEEKAKLMNDLLVHAMSCDLTRIFSYEFSATQSEAVYWEVGITQEHHQYNHDNKRSQGLADITRFIMKNFADLAQKMQSTPDGDGNLLDRTLIMGTSELAIAGEHNYTDHPYIFVGGCGINAGTHYRHEATGNKDAPRCLLTAVRAVGVDVPTLGQATSDGPRVASEPFTELLA